MLNNLFYTAEVWQSVGDLHVGDQVSVDWGRRISAPKNCYRRGWVIKQITLRMVLIQCDTCCFCVSLSDMAAGVQIKKKKKAVIS